MIYEFRPRDTPKTIRVFMRIRTDRFYMAHYLEEGTYSMVAYDYDDQYRDEWVPIHDSHVDDLFRRVNLLL